MLTLFLSCEIQGRESEGIEAVESVIGSLGVWNGVICGILALCAHFFVSFFNLSWFLGIVVLYLTI